jgi:hypothetical protein
LVSAVSFWAKICHEVLTFLRRAQGRERHTQ